MDDGYHMIHESRIKRALQSGISLYMILKHDLDCPWIPEVEFYEDLDALCKLRKHTSRRS